MKTIVIVGATSTLAQAFIKRHPAASFVLVGRSRERLETVASDIRARGAQAEVRVIDQITPESCNALLQEARTMMQGIDLVMLAQGVLIDAADEAAQIPSMFQANTIDVAQWMYATLSLFEAQGRGKLAVFSSVAADRGRATNALYGATKSAISTLIEGLRQRYVSSPDIAIYDIKPGPIDTPMTERMRKTPLFSTAERVAEDVDRALQNTPRGGTIYTPWWWRWIMLVVKALPEFLFFKMKF